MACTVSINWGRRSTNADPEKYSRRRLLPPGASRRHAAIRKTLVLNIDTTFSYRHCMVRATTLVYMDELSLVG